MIQFEVLKKLSEQVLDRVFPTLGCIQCGACGRKTSEILELFLNPLIGTLLLGVEKSLGNKFLDDYMARKLSRSQKFQLKHGHKEKVVNPQSSSFNFSQSSSSVSQRFSPISKNGQTSMVEDGSGSEMDTGE